ncbi:hypothetical protein GCM10010106_13350 [Thermopolyspora flexuosa]|jgi:hypothetical protein|uniref:DoxX-like protein n=1 Tax=Thermopolyspora flexuosa TaxID=103836 RepID=A0A543IQ36_9ACTN|nr:DoxX family protein [Thermopolyspora flexuosa]TQM72693.1 DoxX-like protein [Thermopolyspora flexuosa]GGM68601.1 hypothetical protein GCM10010106_13350 [Thermopolyspora flexuosa]
MADVPTAVLAGVTVACAAANMAVAVADWRRAAFVQANSAKVGVAPRWIPYLGALKMAGALGLVAGFVLTPWLGLAAALGLVLFFLGAVAFHVRARVLHNIAYPLAYLALAAGALGFFATRVG